MKNKKPDIKEIRLSFSKFLPKPEVSKKKNYIGDQIIVEKEQDEEETARERPEESADKSK